MSDSPRILGPYRAELGESPVWDAAAGQLVWLDILNHRRLSTDPMTGETTETALPRRVNCIAQTREGGWIAAGGLGIFDMAEDGQLRPRSALPEGTTGMFNDGKCDTAGRFWVGTATGTGACHCALYSVSGKEKPREIVPGIAMSNGIGWSPDNRTIYFADSAERRVYSAEFDPELGQLRGQQVFFETPEGEVPDGLSVDEEGNVWLAVWGGSVVLCLSPKGDVRRWIDLPTPRVSSCAFGGPNRTTLFITTAAEGASEDERTADRAMGALFAVEPGVRGIVPEKFRP